MNQRAVVLVGVLSWVLAACQPSIQWLPEPVTPEPTSEGAAAAATTTPVRTAAPAPIGAESETQAERATEPAPRPTATPRPTVLDDSAAGRPADMLDAAEILRANALAFGDVVVQGFLAEAANRDLEPGGEVSDALATLPDRPTYRVLYTERVPDKGASERTAEVAIYRYDTAQALLARVDLASGEVRRRDLPVGYPLPLVPEEIAEAAAAARQNPEVRSSLERAGLDPDAAAANGLLTGTVDPASPCATHRCVRLFFSTFREPVPAFSVIVDLVNLAVIEVDPMPGGGFTP